MKKALKDNAKVRTLWTSHSRTAMQIKLQALELCPAIRLPYSK